VISLDAAVVVPSHNGLKSNFVPNYEKENIPFWLRTKVSALRRKRRVFSLHCHAVTMRSRMKELIHCSQTGSETFDE
jgi:hypothetical protein